MGPQRATSEAEKQARERAILDRAWELFEAEGYQALTMQTLARSLGFAKGTLYLYFATKEELFLRLQEEQLSLWFPELRAAFAALGRGTPRSVAQTIATTLAARPAMAHLFTLLHPVLEHNVEASSIRRFKYFLSAEMAETGAALEACLPGLAPGAGQAILLSTHALSIGWFAVAHPAPLVAQILDEDAELTPLKVEFAAMFTQSLERLLAGWGAPQQPQQEEA